MPSVFVAIASLVAQQARLELTLDLKFIQAGLPPRDYKQAKPSSDDLGFGFLPFIGFL